MKNPNNKSLWLKMIISALILVIINLPFSRNNATAQAVSVSINAPVWAPQYEHPERVKYYYMPDIESYYDLNRQQYVYLQNGTWVYTSGLPPAYATYNVANAYVVVLDYNVYNPWRYHNSYRSHYPRYYYRTVYKTKVINNTTIRGFNENQKNVVYNNNYNNNNSVNNKTIENKNVNNKSVNNNNTKPNQSQQIKPSYHDNKVGHPVSVKNESNKQQQKSQAPNKVQHRGNQPKK